MLANNKIVAFVPIRRVEQARTFYEKTLGLTFVYDDQFALVFDANGIRLRLSKVPEFQPFQFTILGWEVTDIEKTVSGLAQNGVQFEKYPWMEPDGHGIWNAPGGTRIAWFKDPDGNILSVSQHPD